MAFVKLDCGMLDSTLWIDREARELFITALLMAEPIEIRQPEKQINVANLDETGFVVPVGWYGFIPAAGVGIIRRAGMDVEIGMKALERLGNPDLESRSPEYEGRRLVRVTGGFVALNYDKYRQKDHTAAERAARYRARKAKSASVAIDKPSRVTISKSRVTTRSVTQAEAEAEEEENSKVRCQKSEPFKIPENIKTPKIQKLWSQWLEHLKQNRKAPTILAAEMQLQKLSKMGPQRAEAALIASIEGNWQGIYEPKSGAKEAGQKDIKEMTDAEILAEAIR